MNQQDERTFEPAERTRTEEAETEGEARAPKDHLEELRALVERARKAMVVC